MFRPIASLTFPRGQIARLQKNKIYYVEDIINDPELLMKLGEQDEIFTQVPKTISALDILREEAETDLLSTSSSALNYILNGGFRCGTITEISGRTGSGKTQFCLQVCANVLLPKDAGGLEGKAIYIDTRNGFSSYRIQGLIKDCQCNTNLNQVEALNNIFVLSPNSVEELYNIIHELSKQLLEQHQIRLLIIDSLSYLIQCIINPTTRTQLYFRIMNLIQSIQYQHNLVVLIVNELTTFINYNGEVSFETAGGKLLAHFMHRKIKCLRKNDDTFAACILKSPLLPETSVLFRITEEGVKDIKRI